MSKQFCFIFDALHTILNVFSAVATLLEMRYNWVLFMPTNTALLTKAKDYTLRQLQMHTIEGGLNQTWAQQHIQTERDNDICNSLVK